MKESEIYEYGKDREGKRVKVEINGRPTSFTHKKERKRERKKGTTFRDYKRCLTELYISSLTFSLLPIPPSVWTFVKKSQIIKTLHINRQIYR